MQNICHIYIIFFSQKFSIDAGVPQGFVLFSALILIYINDLLLITVNKILPMFYLDTKGS